MAIAKLRGSHKPAVATTRKTRRRNRGDQPRDFNAEGLTLGAIYDLALHGAALQGSGSLTGAALDVRPQNAQDIRRLIQPWQARAMSYYDLVPEVKFAATFFSQMLRRVRLFPAIIDSETHEPTEIHEGPLFDEFQRIQDRSGGRSELQGSYAKQKFLIGETYLTISPDIDRGEVWECLSPNELRVQPGGIASRFRAPMLSADQYIIGNDQATVKQYGGRLGPEFAETGPDVIVVYRLWRPHPAYTWLADCSMQAAIDILEELVLSTYSVRAQLKSRLNNGGILWVPDEISFTSLGNDPEEDPTSDEFQERLTTAIMAAISDPGSAAGFSPIVARVAAEFIGKIQLTKFNDTASELAEIKQRSEMVERFAVSSELPPEIFKSQEDLNHWSGWLVDDQTWDNYGLPATLEMAADINAAYLQPVARDELGMNDWQQVCIGYDAADVINRPDNPQDAITLLEHRAISLKAARERFGYNDDDEMPDNERAEYIGVAVRDSSLAWDEIPSVKAGGIEPTPGVIENAAGQQSAPVSKSGDGVSGEPGPPADGQVTVTASAAITSEREQRIMGAAEFAVQRGRELAGSRLRATAQRSKSCPACLDAISGLPNWDVAAALGETQVAALSNGGRAALVDGAGQAFAATLARMEVTAEWAVELGELVEGHAARTLFDPVPPALPAAFAMLLRRIDLPLEQA